MGELRFLIVTGFIWGTSQAQPPPPEAYGRLPAISSAAISPDGQRVALALGFEYQESRPDSDLTALRVVNLGTAKIEHTLAPPRNSTIRNVGWADDQRVYYILKESVNTAELNSAPLRVLSGNLRLEYGRTYVLSLATGSAAPLMNSSAFSGHISITNFLAPIEGDAGFGRMISGVTGLDRPWSRAVFRVNLDDGTANIQDRRNEYTRSFVLDEKGQTIARVDVNEHRNRWQVYVVEAGKRRLLIDEVSDMGLPMELYGLLPDGRIAAVDPHEDGARDTLLAIDLRTGEQAPICKTGGSDVTSIGDPWTRRILGARWTDDLPKQYFFDEQIQRVYAKVAASFADGYATLESWSRDRGHFLVFGEHAGDAGAYYVYDQATDKLLLIGKTYPALDGMAALGDRRAIRFRARDGKSVPAYLTLPHGLEPRKLPLVVLVHGGPHARDTFAFDWRASFLASRGYAVLQVNFRGSTGYGYEWFDAGRGGWGTGVMQTDVDDGADALVKNGMVDAARICIVGTDYGGYAALAGATFTPVRYACAVSVNGLSDPERLFVDVSWDRGSMVSKWWRRSMGEDIEHVREVSPSENVERQLVPVLLIHGTEDTVFPVESTRAYNAKLLSAKKRVRYVELKGGDHWLSSASARTQMLKELETFLAEHLLAGK